MTAFPSLAHHPSLSAQPIVVVLVKNSAAGILASEHLQCSPAVSETNA
jgi:hypothetical protein